MMSNKKFKMPTEAELFMKKKKFGPKKDPVWIYLEREMKQNIEVKPYNEKVGAWLKFMKELKYYYYCEENRKFKRLSREVGPPWYMELSNQQRQVLKDLKTAIYTDLIGELPNLVRKSLSDLGLTIKFPKALLLPAMRDSQDDPGVFIWNLYTAYYKRKPSELLPSYDMNAIILMSSLVFIDLDECIASLEKIIEPRKPPRPAPKPRTPKYTQPKKKYGEYLQKMYAPCYCTFKDDDKKKNVNRLRARASECKTQVFLRTVPSYEKLRQDLGFLQKRKERNVQHKLSERVCHYKFWEPPGTLRAGAMADVVEKIKMLKEKARPRFTKHKAPIDREEFHLGTVAYSTGHPQFVIHSLTTLPTGYIPLNGGEVYLGQTYITNILGFWKYPKDSDEKCEKTCDCLTRWNASVMNHLEQSKCTCGHHYDLYREGRIKEKYFHPPTKHSPYWIDHPKLYQTDPVQEFVRDKFNELFKSPEPSPAPSKPIITVAGLKEKDLVEAFLADLYDSPLLIPHLPKANLLHNLQECVRKRIKGNISQAKHKKYLLQSQRRWLDIKHMDFKARAYRIPFTLDEIKNINWSHRDMVQNLFNRLLEDFISRNRMKQVQQARLFWSTMKYDLYPSEAFMNVYFSHMPGRLKDTFLINPYSSENTPKYGAKTCPLSYTRML